MSLSSDASYLIRINIIKYIIGKYLDGCVKSSNYRPGFVPYIDALPANPNPDDSYPYELYNHMTQLSHVRDPWRTILGCRSAYHKPIINHKTSHVRQSRHMRETRDSYSESRAKLITSL